MEKGLPGVRTYAHANLRVRAMDLAGRLREELGSSWEPSQYTRMALVRTEIAVLGMYV